jgi:DNA processing protein
MPSFRRITPLDPTYPLRLHKLGSPPPLTYVGSLEYERAIAIVGARDAHPEALEFARALAGAVASTGAVVLSGGALGIDGGAHRGALDAGGRTWVLCPTGAHRTYPPEHVSLFHEVARRGGTLVWPFPDDTPALRGNFAARNRVLAAFADALVVVQAGIPSGALNAAAWARRYQVPCYVAAPPPWLFERFRGSAALLEEHGAKVILSIPAFLKDVRLSTPTRPKDPGDDADAELSQPGVSALRRPLTCAEQALVEAASSVPEHAEILAAKAHIAPQDAASALLTLALENVLVEGPAGFFRFDNSA